MSRWQSLGRSGAITERVAGSRRCWSRCAAAPGTGARAASTCNTLTAGSEVSWIGSDWHLLTFGCMRLWLDKGTTSRAEGVRGPESHLAAHSGRHAAVVASKPVSGTLLCLRREGAVAQGEPVSGSLTSQVPVPSS
eukprot:9787970-Alexandrium_andersonii.AAC.1